MPKVKSQPKNRFSIGMRKWFRGLKPRNKMEGLFAPQVDNAIENAIDEAKQDFQSLQCSPV